MNTYLFIAGILYFLMGIIHSILGEYLIFKNKRNKGNIVPSIRSRELKERHLRIIWATWHLSSLLGWCIGVILIKISLEQNELNSSITGFIVQLVIYTTFISSLLVLIGTKGKHPGWIGFLLIGVLLIIGS
jgi:drug/metabolite transporter (DMT)-like permease